MAAQNASYGFYQTGDDPAFDEFLEGATLAAADQIFAAQKSQWEGLWPVTINLMADEQIFIAIESYKKAREEYFLSHDAEGQDELFTDIGRILWCRNNRLMRWK